MGRYNIKRYSASLVLAYQSNATTVVGDGVDFNGLLVGVVVIVPNLDSTNTATITIKDQDGTTVYSKASLARSTTTTAFVDANNYPLQIPLSDSHTITITTSGSQTADRTFGVRLLINSN